MALLIEPAAYGGPLLDEVQQEYVLRYGGPDETPVDPAQFDPPVGVFLVARLDGDPVGCGGLRPLAPGVAEIKRMFVTPRARGQGLARRLLSALEDAARAAGYAEIRLETGAYQPEAITLYRSSGYGPCPPFGHYRDSPLSHSFAKTL